MKNKYGHRALKFKKFVLILLSVFLIGLVSSAHYVVGTVNDANDGFMANDEEVMLFNHINGESDNISDIVGPNGNSGQDNIYIIDCEALLNPCVIGDNLTLTIIKGDTGRISDTVNVTVTTEGYDVAPNLTIKSMMIFESVLVDDANNLTINEIDLTANSITEITCSSIVRDYEGNALIQSSAEFYSVSNSSYGDEDDNNFHYTNNSCSINSSYGDQNQSKIICTLPVFYYAQSTNWRCRISANNSFYVGVGSDDSMINSLLAIGIMNNFTFLNAGSNQVSNESEVLISNAGNIEIDLNLHGYGDLPGDDLAMSCDNGDNISVFFKKYRFSSILGFLTFSQFEANYTNLTGIAHREEFDLSPRENDTVNEATKSTFWRIYVPLGIGGKCHGNIVFGAVAS